MNIATRLLPCALSSITLLSLASAQTTERPSVATGNVQANSASVNAAVSPDGRYVAFQSLASNLAPIDNNSTDDVFLHDRVSGTTTLISANASNPNQTANSYSGSPAISTGGLFVAFYSLATDLVSPPALSGCAWVRDVAAGQSIVVSRHSNGNPAFAGQPVSISASGRYIAYESGVTDIVAGDLNGKTDVFVFDRTTNSTVLASLTVTGVQANQNCTSAALSPDGRFVAFVTTATNLDPLATGPSSQVYVKDLQTGVLFLASQSSLGVAGDNSSSDPHMSANGCVVFLSYALNLVPVVGGGIYLRNFQTNQTERVSVNDAGTPPNNSAYSPDISADGRFVVFESTATNLDFGANPGAWQIFLRDRVNSTTRTVSLSSAGQASNAQGAINSTISADGRVVVFESMATNLVPNDTNGTTDVFLRDRMGSSPFEYGVAQQNSHGCTPAITWSGTPSKSAGSGFTIGCNQVLNKKPGIMLYSTHGSSVTPFQGTFLYLKSPIVRTAAQNSGGSASGIDCTGHFALDFNTWMAASSDPTLILGAEVWVQYWSRDTQAPSASNLSDALTFVIGA